MSEDTTPRMPERGDRIDRLFNLIEIIMNDLSALRSTVESANTTLQDVKSNVQNLISRLEILEERIAPTNQLPKIYAELQELSKTVNKYTHEIHRRQSFEEDRRLDLEEKIERIEERLDRLEGRQ
jgi:chromosome segregation ATPase